MNILNGFNSDLYTGHRVIRVGSWDEFRNLRVPPDCEVIAINKNADINEFYMKQVDNLGNEISARYKFEDFPVKEFDPEKYVTVEEFRELKEDMKNGFDSIKQSLTALSTTGSGIKQSTNPGK